MKMSDHDPRKMKGPRTQGLRQKRDQALSLDLQGDLDLQEL